MYQDILKAINYISKRPTELILDDYIRNSPMVKLSIEVMEGFYFGAGNFWPEKDEDPQEEDPESDDDEKSWWSPKWGAVAAAATLVIVAAAHAVVAYLR